MITIALSEEDARFLFVHLEKEAIRITEEISQGGETSQPKLPEELARLDRVCDTLVAAMTSSTAGGAEHEEPAPGDDEAAAVQRPPADS